MVAHLNKSPTSDPYIRVNDSTAFYNASRSVLTVTKDKDAEDVRLVAQHKTNLARRSPVLRYRLEELVLPDVLDPDDGSPIETARLVEDGESEVSHSEVLALRHERPTTKQEVAEGLLEELLWDGGWHEKDGLEKLAGARGISEPTLRRAAGMLDVEFERRGFPSKTWWRLPQSRHVSSPSNDLTVEPASLSHSRLSQVNDGTKEMT